MIRIRCAHCNRIIFRYVKIGKGRLWHCWKKRIVKDYSIHDKKEVKCECGNIIGVDEGKWIKMKQNAFTYTGARLK
ncbi:MAG: hypothetical protein AYK19_09220 [Theionarchaea archaeon DG-70-1]|nr:MAG: hypothetical protein AYK19_09220 [Theionarchaea archaeon DG-70-1]